MALQTFSGVVVPLPAIAVTSPKTFAEVALIPVVGDSIGTFATVNIGFNTNPPPTTGIVYPLYR